MNEVLFESDLDKINLAKAPLAVFGYPINHSLSPIMQNKALEFLGLNESSIYYKFEVKPNTLKEVLPSFVAKNFRCINLTIPFKEEVLPLLDEIDDFAKMCGACNTLKIEDGKILGYNTDGFGLENAIKVKFGKTFWNACVLIYGAGGAAKAAAFQAGISGAKKIFIANRTIEKAQELAKNLRENGFNASSFEPNWAGKVDIIINATSIGLKDTDSSICDFSIFSKEAVYFDMVYAKQRKLNSIIEAENNGLKCSAGLDMLAWQGAKALQICFDFNEEVLFKVGKIMTKTLEDCIQ